MSRRTRARGRAGFTLIELMVALVVGGVFVGSVYAVAKASTRHFYQQYGVAQMQASLRYAVNQLKKDISKAGLYASPNANLAALQSECGAPSSDFHQPAGSGGVAGISSFTNDCTIGQAECPNTFLERTINNVEADSLVLLGNYATASEYPVARALLTTRSEVPMERQWHAFQRDFTTWFHSTGNQPTEASMGVLSEKLLNQAFMPGRLVRLRTRTGGTHFATISALDSSGGVNAPVRVILGHSIPDACNVSGGWISPLSFIRYVVEDVPANSASAARFAVMQGRAMQLVRREVRPDDKVKPLEPNCNLGNDRGCTPDRIVLDFVVDFNVEFVMADPTTPANPDTVQLTRTVDGGTVQTTPELVRSVLVNLAVRSPEVDPKLAHLGPKANSWDPLLNYYEPIAGMPTSAGSRRAARVRTMTAEIFVPNIAYAGF